jgi:limonene-1,2-epoxide hydrolase
MKNRVISIFVLALMTLVACKQAPEASNSSDTTSTSEAPDYALFDKKVEVVRAFIQAHTEEDLAAQSALLADTLNWSPPEYNANRWEGKNDYLAVLKGYHDAFDNTEYIEGIVLANDTVDGMYSGSVYPKESATNNPGAVRMYGTWKATHSETGTVVGVKWFALAAVNEDGKIAMLSEYFDVHGLAIQIAGGATE